MEQYPKEMTGKSSPDTICAISTPPGVGGIAVVRVSGPNAVSIVDSVWRSRKKLADVATHTAHVGEIIMDESSAVPLDEAVATVFRGPHSFTGEDTVELGVHGSVYIQQQLLELLISHGCRLAEPGEFTPRFHQRQA